MPEYIDPGEQLKGLKSLVEADEPPHWQLENFSEEEMPAELRALKKYTAGTVMFGGQKIELSVMSGDDINGKSWSDFASPEAAGEIMKTLDKISRRAAIGAINDISICLVQPVNPENSEPANGRAPTAFDQDESTGEIIEIPSGAILLFPAGLKTRDYRGEVKGAPHVAGVLAHEWAHQYMATENTELFHTWIESIGGWIETEQGWQYTGSEPLPTRYAVANPVDDFAESMALYILAPESLKANQPERYRFCELFVEAERKAKTESQSQS